jgi:hypothetical protein
MTYTDDFSKSYDFIKSLVSVDLVSISLLSAGDKCEFASIFLKESYDCYIEVMADHEVHALISEYAVEGLDYSSALQALIVFKVFQLFYPLIDSLFEEAKTELEWDRLNDDPDLHRPEYQDLI